MDIDYPAVSAALDKDRFDQLVEDYIQQYPSTYFSLRDFGKRFPTHLKDSHQGSIGEDAEGWLHELALFELRLAQAFDAADCTPVTEQDVTQFSADLWPSLRFEFVPSLRLLDLDWNTPSSWKALTSGQPATIEAVRGETTRWLIWRQHLVTRFRSLEQDEQVMMDGLIQGGTFNEVCMLLTALMDEETVPMRAAGLLKGWVSQGLIASVYYP